MPTGSPPDFETNVDRIIREAIDAGDFDDLQGTGKPIPGAGSVDGEGWWVRSWVERNRQPDDYTPSSSE